MTSSGELASRELGLSTSDLLTSSSYSVSISSGSSRSSLGEAKDAAPAQPAKPGPAKPFIPPKILPAKKFAAKRPLPKRTPLAGAEPLSKTSTADPTQREEQLAALQSQLMMSRATIGKRWKEAWTSAGSSKSALSGESDFDDLDDLDSIEGSRGIATSGAAVVHRRESVGLSSSESALPASSATRDIMTLLEREISSESDAVQREPGRSLNLTSSGFIDDLTLDFVPQESDARITGTPEGTIMPRPLQKLKLRLFQGSGPESSSPSLSSSESSISSVVWRQLPSRETSVPGEQDESMEESEEEEEEEPEEESEEESSGIEEAEEEEEEEERPSSTVTTPSAEGEPQPQLRWEIEQVEGEEEQPLGAAAPKQRVVRRALRAADMAVEDRLEEDACQEDFDRREVSQRHVWRCSGYLTSSWNEAVSPQHNTTSSSGSLQRGATAQGGALG